MTPLPSSGVRSFSRLDVTVRPSTMASAMTLLTTKSTTLGLPEKMKSGNSSAATAPSICKPCGGGCDAGAERG